MLSNTMGTEPMDVPYPYHLPETGYIMLWESWSLL